MKNVREIEPNCDADRNMRHTNFHQVATSRRLAAPHVNLLVLWNSMSVLSCVFLIGGIGFSSDRLSALSIESPSDRQRLASGVRSLGATVAFPKLFAQLQPSRETISTWLRAYELPSWTSSHWNLRRLLNRCGVLAHCILRSCCLPFPLLMCLAFNMVQTMVRRQA